MILRLIFGEMTFQMDAPRTEEQPSRSERLLHQAMGLLPEEQAALVNALVDFTLSPRTMESISLSTYPLLDCSCDLKDPPIEIAHKPMFNQPPAVLEPCKEFCSLLFHVMKKISQLPLDPAKLSKISKS